MSGTTATRAWDDWLAAQAELRDAIAAAAPDPDTAAEGVAYLARMAAAILGRTFNPAARTVGGLLRVEHGIGGANPDYRMCQAIVDPAARYRITGTLHDADRIGFGLYAPQPGFGLDLADYVTTDDLVIGKDGGFTFEVAAGGRLRTRPGATLLITRELQLRPGGRAASLALERLGAPAPAPDGQRSDEAGIARQLAAAAHQAGELVGQFLRWSAVIARASNRITPLPDELDSVVRGDPETRYFVGYYDLPPGTALRVHIPPVRCRYWMIHAITHWLEPIAGASRNQATATRDADGGATVLIGPDDPGRSNWLDTGGRCRGALFVRLIGAPDVASPEATLVRLPA